MAKIDIAGSWLTVNRRCNFRCQWCYAEGTEFRHSDDMSPELSLQLIDLLAVLEISSVIFIGGEPTLWEYLFEANRYARAKGVETHLATNGFLFSNERFLEKFQEHPFDAVGVSLKAGNARQHRELTGSDTFTGVLKGIGNLAANKQEFDVSLVLSPFLSENLDEAVAAALDAGATAVSIDFCTSSFSSDDINRDCTLHPSEAIKHLERHYEKINILTKGVLMIHASAPFCLWPSDFLEELKKKGQIISGCHVLSNDGLILDPQGYVIPCNNLHAYPLGRYGEDFTNADSFANFWQSPEVRKFYNQIITYPVAECAECVDFKDCGGGCPLQWFVFDPTETLKRGRKEERR